MNSRIAAIALTLVVAVPIMLGYALALEEEEITGWETTDKVNITDMMTNSTNPIYVNSTAPSNNAQLYARITYPGTGVTESGLYPPAYVTTSDTTYSSLPTYSMTSATFNVNAYSTEETEGGTYEDLYSYLIYSRADLLPYVYISADQLSQINPYGGQSYLGYSFGPFVDYQGNYYGDWSGGYGTDYSSATSFQVVSDRFPTYTVTTRTYTPIYDDTLGTTYYFTLPGWSAVRIVHTDLTPEYILPSDDSIEISRASNILVINGTTYSDVVRLDICPNPSAGNSITYYYQVTDGYADPSDGWTTDISSGNAVYPYWMNGYSCESIRMMIHIENGEEVNMTLIDVEDNNSSTFRISKTSGVVYLNATTALGVYSYLCADIYGDHVVLSGISAWPDMFAAPTLINSITLDLDTALESFTRIYLNGSSTIEYRVDSAAILSGTYGTIEDYTLDMTQLWPEESYSLALSSIGIYGSSITFAGSTYSVSDGEITVDGTDLRLLNTVFSSVYDDSTSTWSNRINGVVLTTSATPSTIVFGGEWSMTASAFKMEEVTSTELVWQPGEFAFNGVDSSFALMGLITCAGLFVGLGMYGARSGAKVGTLMIICGCAAFVFLALI